MISRAPCESLLMAAPPRVLRGCATCRPTGYGSSSAGWLAHIQSRRALFRAERRPAIAGPLHDRWARTSYRPAFPNKIPRKPRKGGHPRSESAAPDRAVPQRSHWAHARPPRSPHIITIEWKQSRHITRRRGLVPPPFEASPRLALEIENVGVILGNQYLTEMEIAVMADLAAFKAGALEACNV